MNAVDIIVKLVDLVKPKRPSVTTDGVSIGNRIY
jgi:hypothetical protein